MKNSIYNLQKSYELSNQQVSDAVNPLKIAALFEQANVSYGLIGGHMLSFFTGMPRATIDVDFIIAKKHFSKAAQFIEKNFPDLEPNDKVFHLTFDSKKAEKGAERIDLVRDDFPLFREVVNGFCLLVKLNEIKIKIPTIEAAIALKFAAVISPNRSDEDKPVDGADLIRLIRSVNSLDSPIIMHLGDLVYQGGGNELWKTIQAVRNGENVSL